MSHNTEFIAAIRLFPDSSRTRQGAIDLTERHFGCPLFELESRKDKNRDSGLDVRVFKHEKDQIDTEWGLYTLKFLDPTSAGERLPDGTRFVLWEIGDIGEGVILEKRVKSTLDGSTPGQAACGPDSE